MPLRQPGDSKQSATDTTAVKNPTEKRIDQIQRDLMDDIKYGELQPRLRCSGCRKKGNVRVKTASSSGQIHTTARCMNCQETWHL